MIENEEMLDSGMLNSKFKFQKNVRPNLKRAKTAQMLIWIVMGLDILSIFSSYLQYDILTKVDNGGFVSTPDLELNDLREQLIGGLYFIVFIISAVTFIQWFRRAYFNLNERTSCEHTEGWASGAWFVPIISLFRPYQIMKELWDKTTRLLNEGNSDAERSVIGVWWFLWIISNFIGNYVTRTAFDAETIDNFINMTISDIIMSIIGIPLAIVTVKMIKAYSVKEEKLFQLERNGVISEEEVEG